MELTIKKEQIGKMLIELKGIHFVYYLTDVDKVIYIGSTKNAYKRLKDHKTGKYYHTRKYKFIKQFDSVKLVSFDSEINCKRFERYELQRLKPDLNIFGKSTYIEPQNKNIPELSINEKIKISSILNRN